IASGVFHALHLRGINLAEDPIARLDARGDGRLERIERVIVVQNGGRFDHSLGNLGLLLMLDGLRKKAVLADDFSLMEIVSGKGCEVFGGCLFFSLFAVDGPADGVTITGAKYEVSEQSFRMENACLGVSNEVRDGETARIRVRTGRLLLVSVFRE
ncbi:MAG: hypothetical protein IJ873_07820, partial [Lachnospiraceae bacterium]|nr:hypothetical protein [Lachnospiraceae bacterium]